jgi:uncharacterized protein with HEPN domain
VKTKNDGAFLLHIAGSLEKILRYTQKMDFGDFSSNSLVQDAVIRNYEIIGEASKALSQEFRSANPDIDWSGMAGFRDVLIHQYFGIDLMNVWNVTQKYADTILSKLTALPAYKSAKSQLCSEENT